MKLAKREKYFISAAIWCIIIFFLFQFLIFPFFDSRKRIKKGVSEKGKDLQEMLVLSNEYQAYRKNTSGLQQTIAQRERGFTLFSFLEKAAGDAEIKTNIKSMKPSMSSGTGPYKESLVEMKLEKITLDQLVRYLYRIESPEKAVSVKRISINENKDGAGLMDAILQVLTFR